MFSFLGERIYPFQLQSGRGAARQRQIKRKQASKRAADGEATEHAKLNEAQPTGANEPKSAAVGRAVLTNSPCNSAAAHEERKIEQERKYQQRGGKERERASAGH